MLDEKLSKLNESIPEFKEVDETKNKIILEYNKNIISEKDKNKFNFVFKFKYLLGSIIAVVLILSMVIILNDDLGGSSVIGGKTEYELQQEERALKYLSSTKNYYEKYLLSSDPEVNEYTNYLIEQNRDLEASQVVEDVYYEVTIDYANGSSPQKIIVKKGEYVYPEVFSYQGHYFLGWFVDEVKLEGAIEITKDIRIYAKWATKTSIKLNGDYYEYYNDTEGVVIVHADLQEKEVIEVPSYINDEKVVAIETGAFSAYYSGNQNITKKLIIPDSVKYIRAAAFDYYRKLEEVVFPKNLEVLYPNAFSYCVSLKNLSISEEAVNYKVIENSLIDVRTNSLVKACQNSTIPEGVDTIEKRAFAHLEGIKTIIVPNSVKNIKAAAFDSCISLEKIVLPDSVTVIDESLLYQCKNLKEVYLGKNVVSIDEIIFSGCKYLEKIVIPSGNPYYETIDGCLIEKSTMKLLYGGNVSKIPEGVKIIGTGAFSGRSNLTSIEIASTVEEIETGAFERCENLKKVIIGDNVKKIGSYLFYLCGNLEEVVLPKEVEFFGSGVFHFCEELKEVTLPKGVSEIPSLTFLSCYKLEKVNFQEEITSIGMDAFNRCYVLEPIDLSKVTKIGTDAFTFCHKFDKLDLSSAVEIGERAFYACNGLKEVFIPSKVIKIGELAFGDCLNAIIYCEDKEIKSTWSDIFARGTIHYFGIQEVIDYLDFKFIKENDTLDLVEYKGDDLEVTIPEMINDIFVTSIGNRAFYQKKVEKVNFPNTIEVIKNSAFSFCDNLETIVFPNSLRIIEPAAFGYCGNLRNVTLNEGLEKIGESAFSSCNIISIVIPSTVREIEKYAFFDNKYLLEVVILSKNIIIPNSSGLNSAFEVYDSLDYESGIIDDYDDYVFYYNKNDKKVYLIAYMGNDYFLELPKFISFTYNGLTQIKNYEIGDEAFSDNNKLIKVIIPEGVTSIGKDSFNNCCNLTSIIIPKTMKNIGSNAFLNCDHIFEVINYSSLSMTIGSMSNGHIAFNAKEIITSSSSKSKVIDAKNGLVYYIGEEYYIVGYYGTNEKLILPNSINGKQYKIAPDVFKENQIITSVVFSKGVTSIGNSAFHGCSKLEEVYLPSSIKYIGKFAFYKSGVQKVTFENLKNWKVLSLSNPNIYSIVEVNDPEKNAQLLRIGAYHHLEWVNE